MSSNTNDYSHLKELGNSKYEVAKGESDIRNWIVKNEKGNILGEVQDLILDTKARKVLFIVLDLNRNELNLKDRKVLLPLEYADIHESYKNVVYKGLMPNELSALPTYEKGNINRNSLDLTMTTFMAGMKSDNASTQSPANYVSDVPHTNEQARQQANTVPQQKVEDFHSGERGQYTVIGVFEHSNQTRSALEDLLNHGFKKDEITLSARNEEIQHQQNYRDESGISHFFKSLFSNDEDVRKYSEAANRGSVLTVETSSAQQAEDAAEILDQHGSLDVDAEQPAHVDPAGRKRRNSRICERHTGR